MTKKKNDKPIHAIQVGEITTALQPFQGSIKLAFGKVYPSWDAVPVDILEQVTHAADTTLMADRDAFWKKTEGMSILEIMNFARSLIPLDKLPNVRYPWVFFPHDEYILGGFAYCNARHESEK